MTRHEGGTMRFCNASSEALRLLYKLSRAGFRTTSTPIASPRPPRMTGRPFYKVSCFDFYRSDSWLGIKKVALCE